MAGVKRGELWQYSFPSPNRRRPCLVLTRNESIDLLNTVTVAPLTTTIRGVPSEVVVEPELGLKNRSAINLHHLVTVPRIGLRQFIGTIDRKTMKAVFDALRFSLGFDEDPDLE